MPPLPGRSLPPCRARSATPTYAWSTGCPSRAGMSTLKAGRSSPRLARGPSPPSSGVDNRWPWSYTIGG